jgi:hypothetical protein
MQSRSKQWSIAIVRHAACWGARIAPSDGVRRSSHRTAIGTGAELGRVNRWDPRSAVLLSCVSASLLTIGCQDSRVVSPEPPSVASVSKDSLEARPSMESTSPIIVTSVADVALLPSGPFVPGKPFRVITGKHGASESFAELYVSEGGLIGTKRVNLRKWNVPFADRQTATIVEDVVFEKPGYYALTAGVWSRDISKGPKMIGDSVLVPFATARAWVLVDENGGRLDRHYDMALQGEERATLSNGAVGAFEEPDTVNVVGAPSGLMSMSLNPAMTGVVTYVPMDSGTGPRTGIPGALIVGNCRIGSFNVAYYSTATDWLGRFTASCPAGSTSFTGQVKLEASTHRIYINGFFAANYNFAIAANATDTIAVDDEPAKVFVNHAWNGAAVYLYNRSRSQMRYNVFPGQAGQTRYDPNNDQIYMYTTSIWGGWGEFVVAHEYGHAFHYTAIDRWSAYDCSPNGPGHSFISVETSSCAYVEGFADFFAAQMLRGRPLSTQGINIDDLEEGVYRGLGQGLFIEHTFAAALWDLWDDIFSPDSQSGDDDTSFMSGTQIADIMLRCRLYSPNAYLLSHTDQFTYCAEGAVNNARAVAPTAFQGGWGVYGQPLSYDGGTPTLPNLSTFRSIWRYNYYGL